MRQVWIFVRRLAVEATAVFVVALALTAVGAPRAADARSAGKILRVGVLNAERFPPGADPRLPFFRKLKELG